MPCSPGSLARDGFSVPMQFAIEMAATTPFRPLMVVATAALIILATRRGGALVERIAAAGPGRLHQLSRHQPDHDDPLLRLWRRPVRPAQPGRIVAAVVAMWALMLLWSKPWLDRFQYGPLEWLWRSLARGSLAADAESRRPGRRGPEATGAFHPTGSRPSPG